MRISVRTVSFSTESYVIPVLPDPIAKSSVFRSPVEGTVTVYRLSFSSRMHFVFGNGPVGGANEPNSSGVIRRNVRAWFVWLWRSHSGSWHFAQAALPANFPIVSRATL